MAAGYVEMLQGKSFIKMVLQQDNTAVHNVCLTRCFFHRNNITLLNHPVCSLDLTPIDNIGVRWKGGFKNGPVPDTGCPP